MKERILEYLIRLKADAKGAKETTKALEDVDKAATKTNGKPSFFGRLKADAGELRSQIPLVGKAFDVFALAAKGPIAAVVAGIAFITLGWKAARASFSAYLAESEKLAGLDARLAQQGKLTKDFRKELVGLAVDMQAATGIADDQWLDSLGKLVQFGSDPRTIGMDAEALKNLAALLEGDLVQATRLYTLALQGNFGSLAELGIVIDQNASQTEKLAQLQRFAAEKGAGILEAKSRTAAGAIKQLGNETGDLAEAFGRVIARTGFVQGGVSALRTAIGGLNSILPQTTDQLEGLQNKFPNLREELSQTTEEAKKLSEQGIKAVGDAATAADKQLADYINRMRELARAELEVTNARLANELAQVDYAEKRGDITGEQATSQRYSLRSAADARARQIEQQTLATEAAAIDQRLRQGKAGLDFGTAKVEDLQAQRTAPAALVEKADDSLEQIKAQQAKIAEEKARLTKEIASLKKLVPGYDAFDKLGEFDPIFGSLRTIDPLQRKVRPQVKDREAKLNSLSQLGNLIDEKGANLLADPDLQAARDQVKALNDQIEASVAALDAQSDLYHQQAAELEKRKRSLQLQLQTVQTVGTLEADTAQIQRESEKTEEQKKAAADRKAKNLELSKDAATAVRSLGAATGLEEKFETAAKRLDDGATEREIAALVAVVERGLSTLDQKQIRTEAALVSSIREAVSRINLVEAQIRNQR